MMVQRMARKIGDILLVALEFNFFSSTGNGTSLQSRIIPFSLEALRILSLSVNSA